MKKKISKTNRIGHERTLVIRVNLRDTSAGTFNIDKYFYRKFYCETENGVRVKVILQYFIIR